MLIYLYAQTWMRRGPLQVRPFGEDDPYPPRPPPPSPSPLRPLSSPIERLKLHRRVLEFFSNRAQCRLQETSKQSLLCIIWLRKVGGIISELRLFSLQNIQIRVVGGNWKKKKKRRSFRVCALATLRNGIIFNSTSLHYG